MKTLEWSFTDKSNWPKGEWHNEPDKKQWQDPETGLACLIHRGSSGGLCGYVGIDKSHPFFGKEGEEPDVEVHGGLTFASACTPTKENGHGICHVREKGDPEVWWFGFDCAHVGDFCPAFESVLQSFGESSSYKNVAYVEGETKILAGQLAALGKNRLAK